MRILQKSDSPIMLRGWLFGCSSSTCSLLAGTSGGNLIVSSNSIPLANKGWRHVLVTWDGSILQTGVNFYVDGVSVGRAGGNPDGSGVRGSDLGVPLTIGGYPTQVGSYHYNGILDDVRIYNRILTPNEIKLLYKAGQVTIQPASPKTVTVKPFTCGISTVKDADNNTYNTLKIGTQCWMKQNLRVGTMVTVATTQTNNATIEKWCYSNTLANCMTTNNPNYPDGGLYQWDEAMQYSTTPGARGICPSGWHIPTHGEYTTMERAVCTSGSCATDFPYDTTTTGWRGTTEGTKLKHNGTSLWEGNLAGAVFSGSSYARGTDGSFWSSSESGANAWYRDLWSGNAQVYRGTDDKAGGYSVRCLKN